MRRPTRAQVLRRRALMLTAGLLVLLVLGVVLTRGDDDPTQTGGPGSTPSSVPPSDASDPAGVSTPTTTTPTGRFVASTMTGEVVGDGPLTTYRVEVEEGIGVAPDRFGDRVEEILSDPRGWTTAEGISLQRVGTDVEADIVVKLTTPATTDLLCHPMETGSYYSCAPGTDAIINADRWFDGGPRSRLGLVDYRRYLISHEVGHTLGHFHVECPGPGIPTPVMVPQTEDIGDCAPNPWPVPTAEVGG